MSAQYTVISRHSEKSQIMFWGELYTEVVRVECQGGDCARGGRGLPSPPFFRIFFAHFSAIRGNPIQLFSIVFQVVKMTNGIEIAEFQCNTSAKTS